MHPLPKRTALAAALAMALGLNAPAAVAASLVAAKSPTVNEITAARVTPGTLILRVGIFDPKVGQLDTGAVGAAPATATASYAIVQFNAGSLGAQRKALEAKGVQFLGYVPNRAYYVHLGALGFDQLERDPSVRWAGLVQPGLKLDPQLWTSNRTNTVARQADGSYEIIAVGFAGVSSAGLADALMKQVPGVHITLRSQRANATPYVRAAVGIDRFDALLKAATSIDGVAFVSPWVQPEVMNSGAIGVIQGNATDECAGSGAVCGPTPLWDHGLFGSGQIVAIGDTGTTPNAAWFTTLDKGTGPHTEITFSDDPPPILPNIGSLHPDNKIIGYWLQPNGPTNYDYASGHGTHTSGTLVGDAAGTFGSQTYLASTPSAAHHELADGMAPNAQLLEQDMGGDTYPNAIYATDLQGSLEQAYAAGARIHSDSWGGENSGYYEHDDSAADAATRESEGLLVVVAAGNNWLGPMASMSPGNAKNALSVAALGHAGSLIPAWFSNAGPTADGRMKPDIAAPGTDTVSALHGLEVDDTPTAPLTWLDSGTSMATPTVAGNAVLMRQFFTDGFYPRGEKTPADDYSPTGAVMKAVLLNGTNPISALAWPNTNTGWGRAWLDGNLWFKHTMAGGDDGRRLRVFERPNLAGLETGEVNEYTIANVAAGAELRVTLTWFDVPGDPAAASALVNNLDLEVDDPFGVTYRGNNLIGGVSIPGGNADAIDSVEQIRFTAPMSGSYTLRVKATDVPGNGQDGSDRQGYALAVSGAFGLPDPTPLPAPITLQIIANDTNGITLGFGAAAAAQSFQAYRADGTCASAKAGDFHMVANGPASPLTDVRAVGGYSYAYEVRGVQNDVEGLVSGCVDAVSANTCSFQPIFDTNSINITNADSASCSVELGWTAAQSSCPAASVLYTVLRDTDFSFGNPQTLASGAATTYVDTDVVNGVPMFYRVVATDSSGNVAPISRIVGVSPAGSDGPNPATFIDDVDTHIYMTMESPWQITRTGASNGSLSYHNAADQQPYLTWTCASIETPPLKIPAGAKLAYEAQYNLEYQFDGVVSEISTDDGASWNALEPNPFGFPSSFAQTTGNACNFPPSQGAFSGVSELLNPADPDNRFGAPVFLPFTSRLSNYAGQTARFRWRFSSDFGGEYSGFWLDNVRIISDVIFTDGFDPPPVGGDYLCH